jgi:hypothetical protein
MLKVNEEIKTLQGLLEQSIKSKMVSSVKSAITKPVALNGAKEEAKKQTTITP